MRNHVVRYNEYINSINNRIIARRRRLHVHEIQGSTRLAEVGTDPHNHRFSGVTEQAIEVSNGHIHTLCAKTDYFNGHFHEICVRTGLPVMMGEGDDARHVHFIDSVTEVSDGHSHEFLAATLINNPIGGTQTT